VTTSIGAEGMGLQDGVHLFVAEDPATIADRVVALATDDDLWRRTSAAGIEAIHRTLSRAAVRPALADVMRRVGLAGVAGRIDGSGLAGESDVAGVESGLHDGDRGVEEHS
jgi:hypothetical protein